MTKLLNPKLEKRALKTVCSNLELKEYTIARLEINHFYWPVSLEAFKRIKTLLNKKGEIPDWQNLLSDPTIRDESRNLLNRKKITPCKSKKEVDSLIDNLEKYKIRRGLWFNAEETVNSIKNGNFEDEDLLNKNRERITQIQSKTNNENLIFSTGEQNNTSSVVKDMLNPENDQKIPTGFDTFDSVNGGFIIGSLVVLSATTGGGKSTLAQQMCKNMTIFGAKTCYVPLEQNEKEMMQRRLSNLTQIKLTRIIRPEILTEKEKRKINRAYKEYKNKLKKLNTRETWFIPDSDISLEETLLSLKPYNFDVIFLDYINLFRLDGKSDTQWQELGNMSRYAKRFAETNKCIVVLCAQLKEEDNNIRFSKMIKDNANNMWRWKKNPMDSTDNFLEIYQDKARQQKPFKMILYEDFEKMSVRDPTEDELKFIEKDNKKEENKNNFNRQKTKRDNSLEN